MIDFIKDQQIYREVILGKIPDTKILLWIATSDLKDLYIKQKNRFIPFLQILSELLSEGKSVRLIHAKEPGEAFRKDFDKYPILAERLERLLCPRVHFKSVIVDGNFAYCGSANLTGAGMGAKNESKRNFEAGVISDEMWFIEKVQQQFDEIWMGMYCNKCKYISTCPDRDTMI